MKLFEKKKLRQPQPRPMDKKKDEKPYEGKGETDISVEGAQDTIRDMRRKRKEIMDQL